jgi:hypothetical protein
MEAAMDKAKPALYALFISGLIFTALVGGYFL